MFAKIMVNFIKLFSLIYINQLVLSSEFDPSDIDTKRPLIASYQSLATFSNLPDELKIEILSHFIENEEITTNINLKAISSASLTNKKLRQMVKRQIYEKIKIFRCFCMFPDSHFFNDEKLEIISLIFSNLKIINLSNCINITNVRCLNQLKALTDVDLSNCVGVEDLSSLYGLRLSTLNGVNCENCSEFMCL